MKYYLYKLTDPNGKYYVGVTNNIKRRMKEHRKSPWPIGVALREIGEENFKLEWEEFDSRILALEKEFELASPESIEGMYNATVGGSSRDQMVHRNPMKIKEIVDCHPNIWTSEHNPMKCEDSKSKMISSQKLKPVSIDGVEYYGVREAARAVGESRQCVVYRLKSPSFPTWFYL